MPPDLTTMAFGTELQSQASSREALLAIFVVPDSTAAPLALHPPLYVLRVLPGRIPALKAP